MHFVLRLVGEGECRATSLAQRLGIGNPVLSRHIAELEDQGLVARRRDPKDGRAQLVAITPRGAKKLQLIEEDRSATFKKHLQDWEEDEALRTIERLNHLTRSLAKPPRVEGETNTSQQSRRRGRQPKQGGKSSE